jgi:hypothetical protein
LLRLSAASAFVVASAAAIALASAASAFVVKSKPLLFFNARLAG